MGLRTLAAVLTGALVPLVALPGSAEAARAGNYSLVAHRGYTARHPENSLAALAAADRAGATAAEFDVRLSLDGRFVVMHDWELSRTTDCSGAVTLLPAHEIWACRLSNGEGVPSVDAYLSEARQLGINLFLEIKPDRFDRWTMEKLAELRAVIRSYDMARRTSLFSFEADVLQRVEWAYPSLSTVWIATAWPGYRTVVRNADDVALHAGHLTQRRVRRLDRMGAEVYGRNSNRRSRWRRYHRLGVDGLLVDDVRRYRRWR